MEIGKPVPFDIIKASGYSHIYDAVKVLPDGQMLPVTCDTEKEAHKLFRAARQRGELKVIRRRLVIYIGKRGA